METNLHIKGIDKTIVDLLRTQKPEGKTRDTYASECLMRGILMDIPHLMRLFPETIQYVVDNSLARQRDQDRAYMEEMYRALLDSQRLIKELSKRLNIDLS